MAETERLFNSSEIFVLNATAVQVDVYVNFQAQPSISDPKPLVGEFANKDEFNAPVFVVKNDNATPYGAYTFTVRPKGDPAADILGEASIDMHQGHSYTGVFHELDPGEFQFSIYENDLSDGSLARLTVIHAALPPEVTWQIRPNGEDPRIEPDIRSGTLQRSQWQIATNITDNDYFIEFFVDGQLVASNPDLDLARAKNFVVVVFGDPQPASNKQLLLRPMVYQELEFDPGPAEPTAISPGAPPLSISDTNAPGQFTCDPVELWQTNQATTIVSAVDPDGMVRNLSIDAIVPQIGGIDILGGAFRPSIAIGKPATVEITFKSDIPHGTYGVIVAANRGTLAHQATCTLQLTVRPITVERLRAVVGDYRQAGEIEPATADALIAYLDDAEQYLSAGQVAQACQALKDFLTLIGSEKGKAVSDAANDHIERETKALRADLGCG